MSEVVEMAKKTRMIFTNYLNKPRKEIIDFGDYVSFKTFRDYLRSGFIGLLEIMLKTGTISKEEYNKSLDEVFRELDEVQKELHKAGRPYRGSED